MTKRALALLLLLALAAVGGWYLMRDDEELVVAARFRSLDDAEAACEDLPGIIDAERTFSVTSDLGPDDLAVGLDWPVKGRARADDVAECFREHGGQLVQISERGEPQSFDNTGP
jgi:hypothetical protein